MRYIIGVGNYSMYDDSIGIRVIEYIEAHKLEDNFQAIDLSGNALNIFSYLDPETEKIVIVDTATLDKTPGDYLIFEPREVVSEKELSGFTSHEGDMIKVLALGKKTGYHIPEIKFLGIEAETIKNEFGLSKTLEDKLETYVKIAIEEVGR